MRCYLITYKGNLLGDWSFERRSAKDCNGYQIPNPEHRDASRRSWCSRVWTSHKWKCSPVPSARRSWRPRESGWTAAKSPQTTALLAWSGSSFPATTTVGTARVISASRGATSVGDSSAPGATPSPALGSAPLLVGDTHAKNLQGFGI